MGLDITGHVLRAPQSAPSNATTSAPPTNGVLRDVRDVPGSYVLPADLAETAADQYRSAVLRNPHDRTVEYLIWAANSSNLSIVEDNTWLMTDGTVGIPDGGLTVLDLTPGVTYTDGTARLVVTDNGGRSIASVRSVIIARGDSPDPSNPIVVEAGPDTPTGFASQDADAGVVTLASATLTALGGGVSATRGDTVDVEYVLAASRFWWTRNDYYATRFEWNGKVQRWMPRKGTAPINLGTLLSAETYTLSPHPTRFTVGDTLPADLSDADSYAMVRVGLRPDKNSTPAFVLVVSDEEAEEGTHDFSADPPPGPYDAVVGVTNGIVLWNSDFIDAHIGETVWYVYEDFQAEQDGTLGELRGSGLSPLFLCPIPEITDRPFVRLGFRRYLTPTAHLTDTEMDAAADPADGAFYWSRATGKIRLSPGDIAKADPDDPMFDIQYLGTVVYYDGVSLTQTAVPTKQPVQLVNSAGVPANVDGSTELFVPAAEILPGLGISGVNLVPDGTGGLPNTGATPVTRPNGSGLVRQVSGMGDTILFGKAGAIETIQVDEFEIDMPDFPFLIRKGKSHIACQAGLGGSKVMLSLADRIRFAGSPIYFLQADLTPAVYTNKARILSREMEPFVLQGDEVLAFAVDGTAYLWDAIALGAGSYTAAQVATSLDAVITGTGQAYAMNGRIYVESGNLDTGSVEIGFGSIVSGALADRDLSGCAVLGFLPGWRVDPANDLTWLPDNGVTLGLSRSPVNLDRSKATPDFKERARFSDIPLSSSITASPVFPINNPPLQDVAGYDENVFFELVEGLNTTFLRNFQDVLYEFADDRFSWLDGGIIRQDIDHPVSALTLGQLSVVPDSLHPAVAAGNGLYVSENGGPPNLLDLGDDYLLPSDGQPGLVLLVEQVGALVTSGTSASFVLSGTTFTDPNADFITTGITPGYRLKVLAGDAEGSYIIASVTSATVLEIDGLPAFIANSDEISWQIFAGVTPDLYDPGIVADVLYEEFNHLPAETFEIRELSSVGVVPANAAAQALNRLVALVADALEHARPMSIRFGQPAGSTEATIYQITRTELGVIANDSLVLSDLLDPHYLNADFSIRINTVSYTTGAGTLVGVNAFSALTGDDKVEYGLPGSGIDGQLKFGSVTLDNLEGARVYYIQEFLTPSALAAGTVELNSATGDLNFSEDDMSSYGGTTAYFVEQIITEKRIDVTISPLGGAFYLAKSLRYGQLVEASYSQADDQGAQALDANGDPIETTEFLPIFIRRESATFIDNRTWAFNPTARTVATDVRTRVWVNDRLQNFANVITAIVDTDTSRITFAVDVPSGSDVTISYAVYEAFGGEQAFSTSVRPVYRPSFFLAKGSDTFTLKSDRTGDMIPGKLFRLGANPFYIQAAAYDAGSDETTVTIFPTPDTEVGSRAPGNDVLCLLSTSPVTTDVNGIPTGGDAGFLLDVVSTYEPVDKGMFSIVFQGDMRRFAVAGHLMEIGGYPLIVGGSTLSDDGRYTKIDVTSYFPVGFDPSSDAVKLSARPIYPPDARQFVGINPLVEEEGHELVIFGEAVDGNLQPGRTLVRTVEYDIDPTTGNTALLEPVQAALAPGQRLALSYTRLKTIVPYLSDGNVILPWYRARYAYVTTPSEENGLMGSALRATYTFRSPDTFYYRTVPLTTFMGDVAEDAVSAVAAHQPHGGPVVVSGPEQHNWTFGTSGLLAERRDLEDRDRAARQFIDFYDRIIVAFEQILETIDGRVIGDRDGKFRFFVGQGKDYPPPGYEDPITGTLNPRDIWAHVFLAANGNFTVTDEDPVVDPLTATQDPITLEVSGVMPDPHLFGYYREMQRSLIRNDIDDIVMVRMARPTLVPGPPFVPFPIPEAKGVRKRMGDASVFSRIFPEMALAFTTTYPGLGADITAGNPGVYAFLRMIEPPPMLGSKPVLGSTFRQPIGSLSNPALGTIENVTDAEVRDRLPRARIWAYSPVGFPELDSFLGPAQQFGANPRPAVIATPLFLKDFPVDPDTGLPDVVRLITNGGELSDLGTGDAALSTPAWQPYNRDEKVLPQVSFGSSNGSTYAVGYAQSTISSILGGSVTIDPVYKGIFVYEVLIGCIITFTDGGTAPAVITNADDILRLGSGSLDGEPFAPVRGDTIYVIPPNADDTDTMSDPPKLDEIQQFASNRPTYQRGVDVGVQKRGGNFIDLTMPSIEDPSPFPFKEIFGQHPPKPLTTIEALVEFVNNDRKPFNLPALKGESTNDDGDYGIPYLSFTNTELDRLGEAADAFTALQQTDTPIPSAVYPDEILGADGTVNGVGVPPPAVLLTASDLTPVTTAGAYTPHSGIGDTASFDLLLVEVGTTIPAGAHGIQSVGRVATNQIEPPRFVTPTRSGDRIRYTFNNAMVHLTSTGLSGVVVQEGGGNTTLDITSVGGLFLNDGSGAVVGGLNDIVNNVGFPFPNDNVITIRIYSSVTGSLLETITIDGTAVTGGLGAAVIGAAPTFTDKVLTVPVMGFVDFVALGGGAPGPVGPFDFSISIDTENGAAVNAGSITGSIETDRLTFVETLDLRTVQPRGTTTIAPGNQSVEGQLSVIYVTAAGVDDVTVNNPASVNGAAAFTFLSRDGSGTDIGTFDPSPGTGEGSVRVMGFEGFGNAPVLSTGAMTFAAVPSSDQSANGVICQGTGLCDAGDPTFENRIANVTVALGAVSNVEAGDILIVQSGSTGDGSIKAGTYLVRHAVEEFGATPGAREATLSAMAGPDGQWVKVVFPTIVTSDAAGAGTVEVTETAGPGPTGLMFSTGSRIYVVPNPLDLTTVVSIGYIGDPAGNIFTVDNLSAQDSAGAPITAATFDAVAVVGTKVSGMTYLSVGTTYPSPLPSNNVAGFGHVAGTTVGGFRHITFHDPTATSTVVYSVGGVNPIVPTPPGVGELGVNVPAATASNVFVPDVTTPIYEGVATYLDISNIATDLDTLHGGLGGVRCLVPLDRIVTDDNAGTDGFLAQAGIFLEPSFPVSVLDLGDGTPKVVDASHGLGLAQVGMRAAGSFSATAASPEGVTFEVKRIRRFHDVLVDVNAALTPLRFAYETRTGTVNSYTAATRTLVATGTGTQLGGFTDGDVNIHPGDVVRLLDADGTLLDQAEIVVVTNDTTVVLAVPGFTVSTVYAGKAFEIYLYQPPVPHEQSNAQLLDLITDSVILTRTADPTTGTGGRVDAVNELLDNTPGFDFSTLGLQDGDIVLVDPAGQLAGPTGPATPVELGARPFGDRSVIARVDGSYVAGAPSDVDDNRGWYRITGVPTGPADPVVVSGVTSFTGSNGSDVVFGAAGQEFAVYPTIHASGLPGLVEGQMDLRSTAPAGSYTPDPNSYQGGFTSVEPFSYRIIRPSRVFSEETVDLVLHHRERVLSWMEEIRVVLEGLKQGSYFIFQRDEHVSDIGNPTNPDDGLGVISNALIDGLSGLTQYAPFASVSDCLSVLDRRFWCLDYRLDSLHPPYQPAADPYASFATDNSTGSVYTVGSGRPVLPDLVDGVLDRTDRFRNLRFAWIKYRTDRVSGTLPSIDRFDEEYAERKTEEEDLLRLRESVESGT